LYSAVGAGGRHCGDTGRACVHATYIDRVHR
jgi:hypothetical protein